MQIRVHCIVFNDEFKEFVADYFRRYYGNVAACYQQLTNFLGRSDHTNILPYNKYVQ